MLLFILLFMLLSFGLFVFVEFGVFVCVCGLIGLRMFNIFWVKVCMFCGVLGLFKRCKNLVCVCLVFFLWNVVIVINWCVEWCYGFLLFVKVVICLFILFKFVELIIK